MAQLLVQPGRIEANLARAELRIREAKIAGADLVLLPEALDCGWTHPSARVRAEPIPSGGTFARLSRAARKHALFVCAGLAERCGDRLFNAAVLIDPKGRLLLHHRKINELDFARELYACGDRLGVVDTALGRIGLMICADAFVSGQVISRTLGTMGAKMILSPCAWAVPPDHDNLRTPYGGLWLENYQPVARDFGLWIAGCSHVGPITAGTWKGWRCIGNSLAVDPGAQIQAQGRHGVDAEELMVVQVPRA
jgi:predicted amidohydrolase